MSTDKNAAQKIDPNKIMIVSMSEVDFDEDWNARSKRFLTPAEGEVTTGIDGLAQAIGLHGQNTPVDLVVHPDPKKRAKTPYFLAAGYRRRAAIAALHGKGTNIPLPGSKDSFLPKDHMRGMLHINAGEDTPSSAWRFAKRINIEENAVRENLTAPDLAHALIDYAGGADKPVINDLQVSQEYGLNQAYVNSLLRIMRQVKAKVEVTDADGKKKELPIVTAWRESAIPLSVKDMVEVAACPVSEQTEKYLSLMGNKSKTSKGPSAWVQTSCKQASKIGGLLARLELNGHADVSEHIDWDEAVEYFGIPLSGGKKDKPATAHQRKMIVTAARDGWEAAMTADEEAKAKAEADAKEAKAAAKKKNAEGASAN